MKKELLSMLLLAVATCPLFAEEVTDTKVESKPKQVTVFLTGAELRHSPSVELKAGKNMLHFTGLSSKLDPNSIVVDAERKELVILSVYSSNNFLAPLANNPKAKAINDSIERTRDELAVIDGMKETLTQEKDLLYKNNTSTAKVLTAEELQKSAEFFRKRSNEISVEVYQLTKQVTRLNDKLSMFSKQLVELNAIINPPSSEVTVLVLANSPVTSVFDLKYRVLDAGWEPKYDIRVEGVTKPVNLYYKANVFNNTGVDWMEVKMKLSTADPLQGAQHPLLSKWSLKEGGSDPEYTQYYKTQVDKMKQENKNVDFKTVEVDELSAEFDIAQPYSILADSKPYLVEVANRPLNARYEYVSIPKMDKDAFLIAKVVGWSDMNLVSGNASIYFNGSYIGQSKINILEISDTLELSLGRDNKIAISRVKKSELNEHEVLGNFEKEVYNYEMVIKNNREIPLTIKMQDQVPVEDDSRIDVKIREISGGIYDKSSGDVTWVVTLQPGEIKKLTFNFSTRYPKDEFIPKKKKFRTVSCPSF